MKQQINLFLKQEKVRTPASALTCTLVVLGLTVVLVLLSVYETQRLSQKRQDVAALKQQKSELDSKTQALQAQKRPKTESPALRQQRDQLKQKLAGQRRFGELLQQLAPPGSGIFSPLLTGLSEQALSGVWLTRIQASQNGVQISLQGHTRSAELVPKYLKRLGQAPAYQNTLFDQFELTEASNGLEFRLSGSRSGAGGA
ncbi:MAG: PilN domain-containing protein [Halopseudomonas sp.]